MMIDTKAFMEVCQKRTELFAQVHVHQTLLKITVENAEKCRLERNFSQMQAWVDTGRELNAKLITLTEELRDVTRLMESM